MPRIFHDLMTPKGRRGAGVKMAGAQIQHVHLGVSMTSPRNTLGHALHIYTLESGVGRTISLEHDGEKGEGVEFMKAMGVTDPKGLNDRYVTLHLDAPKYGKLIGVSVPEK